LLALPTIRNTAGVDILASSADGNFFANIHVKTSQRRVTFWPIGTSNASWRGTNCFYAFVRRVPSESRFEVFIETASRVANEVDAWERRWKEIGNRPFAPCWFLVEPSSVGEED
jgi:hypothetical protein